MKSKQVKTEPTDTPMDDFVVVGGDQSLPLRPKHDEPANLQITQLSNDHGVLVSFNPPSKPPNSVPHVPVDITLVIDVSGSMQSAAPLLDTDNEEERESTGLSVLDLTKHAARTILASLNEFDRLAIVTFSTNAKIVQPLTYITPATRSSIAHKIDALVPQTATNLWAGIKTGLQVFEKTSVINNVQGIFVLTDGMPNHMCPPQGYVNKLKPILAKMAESRPSMPSIHTFGFGYEMRSDLMQSIAEVGHGSYAFIPDAGMIGTMFVHAMANLFSTYCTGATIEIQSSDATKLDCSTVFDTKRPNLYTLILNIGNIQYGQSRDFIIRNTIKGKPPTVTAATINYKTMHPSKPTENGPGVLATASTRNKSVQPAIIDYHVFRTLLCAFLASFFPIQDNGEHSAMLANSRTFEAARSQLNELVNTIKNSPHVDDPNIASLLNDLVGADTFGQISKALMTEKPSDFYSRWGRHYLPSLLHAHARQVCNSFKDPGPLQYGVDSPLFIQCRDQMDSTFENMPAPQPSRPPQQRYDGSYVPRSKVSMARYHSSSNVCFAGQCEVSMGNGSKLAVSKLRPGMSLWTPKGARKVIAIVKSDPKPNGTDEICRVGDLWVTPYHPIYKDDKWVFPADVADEAKICDVSVYSVILAYSNNPEAHAVEVGGEIGVTLGHGIRQSCESMSDARAHAFFGDYVKVVMSLMRLSRDDNGHLVSNGVKRDLETGLISGFKAKGKKGRAVHRGNRRCVIRRGVSLGRVESCVSGAVGVSA